MNVELHDQSALSPVKSAQYPLDKISVAPHSQFEQYGKMKSVKNGVFWDVTPCGSCKNRRFGGT
jgi:hypothetical protein